MLPAAPEAWCEETHVGASGPRRTVLMHANDGWFGKESFGDQI